MKSKPIVVLVAPKGEANLGSIARLMMNFDSYELRLVNPRCDRFGDDVKRMSLEAFTIVEQAKIFESLDVALADCRSAIAVSARLAGANPPMRDLREGSLVDLLRDHPVALVFGREDNGLEAEELRLCQFQVQIPTSSVKSSMNLASAAAVVLYELFKCRGELEERLSNSLGDLRRPLHKDSEIFFTQLFELLRAVDFLKSNSDTHIIEDLRDIYHRADIRMRDLRILFGMVSDLRRCLGLKSAKKLEVPE